MTRRKPREVFSEPASVQQRIAACCDTAAAYGKKFHRILTLHLITAPDRIQVNLDAETVAFWARIAAPCSR